jgi:hypothetical protein
MLQAERMAMQNNTAALLLLDDLDLGQGNRANDACLCALPQAHYSGLSKVL